MITDTTIKSDQPVPETNKAYLAGALLAYIAVEITGMFFHPMWRDEIHPWSMAGASSSLLNLMQTKAVEGHPDLWYVIVYAVRSLSDSLLTLQLFHSGIAILTVFLVLKYAPFSRVKRVLLVFGYFFLFEYAMITRNYSIGVLFITLILILYRDRTRLFLYLSLILFLLAQTNVYGLILCMSFLASWVFEWIVSRHFRQELLRKKTVMISGIILVMAGIAWSVHSIMPPSTGYFAGASDFSLSQLTLHESIRTAATVWKAWVPLPKLTAEFWDTNFVRFEWAEAILSILLVFSAGALFVRRPVVFFLFVTGLAGITGFILMYYYGYIRHHGHLYILLISCLWLATYYRENNGNQGPGLLNRYSLWMRKHAGRLFSIILWCQLLAGLYAVTVQFLVPFSAAKVTAGYIAENHLNRFLIAGDQDVALEPVAGYLQQEAFFFSRNAFSSYLIYDDARVIREQPAVLAMADSLSKSHGDTILLVMNTPIEDPAGLKLRKMQTFEKSIRWDEKYYLYLLYPTEPEAAVQTPAGR